MLSAIPRANLFVFYRLAFIVLFFPEQHGRPDPHSKTPVQFYSPCVAARRAERIAGVTGAISDSSPRLFQI